jgi:tetratricopeptide (TPR) repeat protein
MVKNNLGLLYGSTGEYEDAERLFCDILSVKSGDPVVTRNLADLYYRLNVYGAAREYYEQTPDGKRDHSLLVNLGHIYLSQGDRTRALSLWEQARDLEPDDQDLIQNIEALQAIQALPG